MNCSYALRHYEDILRIALERGYAFKLFDQLEAADNNEKVCILRHDVDYMPEWAINLGRIENKFGIISTYFFQVCSSAYNLRRKENARVVRLLKKMGHEIGLHFDISWYDGILWEDVAGACKKEKELFLKITEVDPCEIISFHNTHLYQEQIINKSIYNLKHTYEERYFAKIKYLSDSQGWYEGCVCKIFDSIKYPKIQLLTHPYLWPEDTKHDFIEDIAEIIAFRAEELANHFLKYHPVCRKHEHQLYHVLSNAMSKRFSKDRQE